MSRTDEDSTDQNTTDQNPTDQNLTNQNSTDEETDDALRRLDTGLELVIEPSGARWQMPGRKAIRFEVERETALRLLRSLSDRFHTRHPSGRHVLTPEPRVDDTARGPTALLFRRWHTMKELGAILGKGRSAVLEFLQGHRERLIFRRLPSRGRAWIVRTTLDLAHLLDSWTGLDVQIDVDETLDVRSPAPESVTLERVTYTLEELGTLGGRSPDAAHSMCKREGVEVLSRPDGEPFVVTGPALKRAMERYWRLEVTIVPEAQRQRADPKKNEQPA